MARITVEDCLKNVDNRFALIHLAAKRVRQLRKGAEPLVPPKNKDIVVALREVAAGKVFQVKRTQEEAFLSEGAYPSPQLLSEPETSSFVEDEVAPKAESEGLNDDE